MQRRRELQKHYKELAKASAQAQAAYEVQEFENYLELLVSLHRDRSDVWSWQAIAATAPPAAPTPTGRHETHAAQALRAYVPGFFDKLFGAAKKRTVELQLALEQARQADQHEFGAATKTYQDHYTLWDYRRHLSHRILARDTSAYFDALQHAGAFDELVAFQTQVAIAEAAPDAVVLVCRTDATSPVPNEELKLTAAGKVSTKAMAPARFWALHQDFVCSSALRVAGEALAVLPIDRAIVNVGAVQTNTATGHPEFFTFLAVHFARSTLLGLNLGQVDASDCMKNFPHRMKFKKTSGLEPIEPMSLAENWVST